MGTWACLSFRTRTMVSAALVVTTLLLTLGFTGVRILRRETNQVFQERLRLVDLVARQLDSDLAADRDRLRLLARSPLAAAKQVDHQDRALAGYWGGAFRILSYGLVKVDRTGKVEWTHPEKQSDYGFNLGSVPAVRETLSAGRGQDTSLFTSAGGKRLAGFVEPVFDAGGQVDGALLGLIDLQSNSLDGLLANLLPDAATAHAVLVDREAWVLASTKPEMRFTRGEHPESLTSVIRNQLGEVGFMASNESNVERHVMASVPLKVLKWALALGQGESEAMASVIWLRRLLILFRIAAVVIAAAYAWWETGAVTAPLARLTTAAGEIASGNLDSPIGITRGDEIGALARAFDLMRVSLRDSRAQLEQAHERVQSLAIFEERDRIARELHDSAAQALGYLYSQLRLLQDRYPAEKDPVLWAHLDEMARAASATYDEVRWSIFGLRTDRYRSSSLLSTVAGYLRDFTMRSGVRAEMAGEGWARLNLPAKVEAQVMRVIQEALTNVGKHAQASRVWVKAATDPEFVTLTVEDDGTGFDPERALLAGHSSFGLAAMRERVSSAGGRLDIDSHPGAGTRVVMRIPRTDDGGVADGSHQGTPG